MKILIAANRISSFQPTFDTSLRISGELLRRGHEVFYVDLDAHSASLGRKNFLEKLPAQKILSVNPKEKEFIKVGAVEYKSAVEFAAIFQRRDPPVDSTYRAQAEHFASLPAKILQVNNPNSAIEFSEHQLPSRYPQFGTPTWYCENESDFLKAAQTQKTEFVAKPDNQCSGVGIEFFKTTTSEATLKTYFNKWSPVVVQPFLPEIQTLGDVRILTFNQMILGSVARIPAPGSRLGNLHQGATIRAATPTPKQIEACKFVSKDLHTLGLYFLGLDFIGDYLNEVNITSPSALVQVSEVMGKDKIIPLIDEFEALLKSHKSS